jgi:hypothetical protein
MMALPTNLTSVTVTGAYVDYSGTAIKGQVTFTLGDVLRSGIDNVMVAPSTVVVSLVNGAFSVTLPATNDPDVIPNPYTYTVVESFTGGRTYTISIPYDTVGSLDLADISPLPTIATTYVQLIDQTTWNTLAGEITTLDTAIDQSTNTIPATGQYWYIGSGYATYTALDAAFATYTALNAATFGLTASSISQFVSPAQAYATAAADSASQATANAAGTISPLLLIGG